MNAGLHRDPPGYLKLSREVAIKVLPPAIAGRRFERETQVLVSVNHPISVAISGMTRLWERLFPTLVG